MKQFLITTVSAISLITSSYAMASNENTGHVMISVEGLKQSQGQAIFVLMDSASSHQGETPIYRKIIQPIENLQSVAEFDLPEGEYSAVVYHDVNANGKLDTWFYGKPKEPYGFSNDARNSFGIPSFEASRFVVNSESTQLKITVE